MYYFFGLGQEPLDFSRCEIRVLSPEKGQLGRIRSALKASSDLRDRGWRSPEVLPTLSGWAANPGGSSIAIIEGSLPVVKKVHVTFVEDDSRVMEVGLIQPGKRALMVRRIGKPPRNRFSPAHRGE